MSKKNKHKKPRIVSSEPPTRIVFSFAAVRMLKDALGLVDQAFQYNTKSLPNLELAVEVLASLQIKLDEMLQQEDWEKETPFDYNEIHILYAAIHMWLAKLTFEGKHTQIELCLVLCKQFARLVERIEGKRSNDIHTLDK